MGEIRIALSGGDGPEKAKFAEGLLQVVTEEFGTNGEVRGKLEKQSATTMDFGATLVLVLGTPAIIVVAKAMRDYFKRTNTGVIQIDGRKISVTGMKSEDIASVLSEAMKNAPGQ